MFGFIYRKNTVLIVEQRSTVQGMFNVQVYPKGFLRERFPLRCNIKGDVKFFSSTQSAVYYIEEFKLDTEDGLSKYLEQVNRRRSVKIDVRP